MAETNLNTPPSHESDYEPITEDEGLEELWREMIEDRENCRTRIEKSVTAFKPLTVIDLDGDPFWW